MSLRGVLLVWIGLMGVAATGAVLALLRLFPRAFSDTGQSVVWPWRAGASRSARARGALLTGAGIASLLAVIVGIVRVLS